uniref:Myohemerythrin n=1 Tax=Riftia pachyptila TaxID=6426 RepID=HEMTM_RIFPA|nr:RecName: Full=Myohemerythrin; Short=MHr [Riftia pachyptila]ABW24415.1 myohemerythrin [Riftia pachyptila]
MSFEVPSPYVWDDSFRVAYDNLDSEHQALFKCIAKCAENRADAAALADLVKVTVDHFADEERMMAKTNFSGLPEHNKIHSEFVAKIKSLSAPLDDATVAFAKQWLVNHIKGIDFKYKGNL